MFIEVINRKTGQIEKERVYGGRALNFVWGKSRLGALVRHLVRLPFFSKFYGALQKGRLSKKKIAPFIETFGVDTSEFKKGVGQFSSFNDFFTRELKEGVRPISDTTAVMPADGRYLFFKTADEAPFFSIKKQKFTLESFLQDQDLAKKYEKGPLIIGRLCPFDYHRFHFPIDSKPSRARPVEGALYSVNPIALAIRPSIFCENRRLITSLKSEIFGEVLMVEIGATNVGSIHQTYQPDTAYRKGDEKGYFSFGGSAIALLFPKGMLTIDPALLANTKRGYETYCQMGESINNFS